MTMFVTSQIHYYNAQQRVKYYSSIAFVLTRILPRQYCQCVAIIMCEVMSVDAPHIHVILPKELCATDAILLPWEMMRYYLIMSHTKDIYQLDKWRN